MMLKKALTSAITEGIISFLDIYVDGTLHQIKKYISGFRRNFFEIKEDVWTKKKEYYLSRGYDLEKIHVDNW